MEQYVVITLEEYKQLLLIMRDYQWLTQQKQKKVEKKPQIGFKPNEKPTKE